MSASESPVFHDPQGRRCRRVRRIWLGLSIVVSGLAVVFIASVLANPVLPKFNLKQIPSLPRSADLKPKAPNLPANPVELFPFLIILAGAGMAAFRASGRATQPDAALTAE